MYNITNDDITQCILEHLFVYWGYSFILLQGYRHRFNPPLKAISLVIFNQCIGGYVLLNVLPIELSIPVIEFKSNLFRMLHMFIYIMLYYVNHCIWFYLSHRLLHIRFFWKHIHYVHHTYKNTLPFAAFYCHPVEHIMSNLMSVFIGPILLPCDSLTLKLWLHLGTLHSVHAHFSELRGNNPGIHDLHHLFYRFNYGTGEVMDKIFGTYMKPTKL